MPRSSPFRNGLALGLLLAASLSPLLAWAWIQRDALARDAVVTGAIVSAAGATVLLSMLPLVLFGRLRLLLCLLLPAAALSPLESFYVLFFGQPSGSHVYGVIAEATWDEVQSWTGPYLWVALGVWLVYLLALGWAARCCWQWDWRWQHRSRRWAGAAAAGLLLILAALRWADSQLPDPLAHVALASSSETDLEFSGLAANIEPVFPWGLPLRWQRYAEHGQAVLARRVVMQGKNLGVRWLQAPGAAAAQPALAGRPAAALREVHVLVIGETARPDRWGLYGAARDTTPRLMARDGLIVFTDAISAAAATRQSVPMILTAHRAPDAPSLPGAFRQAGYRTDFLSNQGAAGRHETPVAVLAREADGVQFINAVDYRGRGAFDGELLLRFRAVLARRAPRQFIVLHTLGSHLHYAHRHPPEFERFRPALAPDQPSNVWNAAQTELLRNAYDNSVLYTDWVLDEVIGELQTQGVVATLTYVADHGETLFDGDCGRAGHGFLAETNYRIPMLIWTSALWQASHPERQAALVHAQHRPVSALSTFATVTGLAGFTVAEPGEHPDLGRADDSRHPPRVVNHHGDFDRLIRGRSCSGPSPKLMRYGGNMR